MTIDEACVFVDDGISGAEFATRPGFVRLMNALKQIVLPACAGSST